MKLLKIFILTLIIIFVLFRIALPYYLLKYVENQINKIPEYRVKIADLDIHLYRGGYTIKDIQLWKITKNIPVPFYAAKSMDFSLDTSLLLHGKILAKIVIQQPKINFVTDPSGKNEQLGISSQWLEIVKSLYPLNIDRADAHEGEVSLSSFKGNPPYRIYVTHAEFSVQNMQKATQEEKLLPSSYMFKGNVIGGGSVKIEGRFDPFKKQPTFKIKASLNSLKVAHIKNFLKHYTAIDISGGTFRLYGEAVAAQGKIKGYAKPFIKDLKIGNTERKTNPLSAIVNSAASIAAAILENPKQKTIATKVNISGEIDDPDTSLLSIMGYLIQHAFIQALLPQIDNSVKMEDVLYGKSKNTKSKFPRYQH